MAKTGEADTRFEWQLFDHRRNMYKNVSRGFWQILVNKQKRHPIMHVCSNSKYMLDVHAASAAPSAG
jgi:hypothetical protein